jgi:hypothetical protein
VIARKITHQDGTGPFPTERDRQLIENGEATFVIHRRIVDRIDHSLKTTPRSIGFQTPEEVYMTEVMAIIPLDRQTGFLLQHGKGR